LNHSTDLLTTYSMPLIILAFVIAACSSFCALELVDLVKGSRAQTRRLWLWAGAASFGLGTWAMHFIGMLAFDMQMPIGYHLPTVLFSMLPVMAAAAFALSLAASEHLTKQRLFGGAVLLGVGIGGMHYSGMFAMRMEAAMYFDPKFLVISVLFAVGASLFALYSAFDAGDEASNVGSRFISATIMGGAITGLHFTAMMNASHFAPIDGQLPAGMIPSPVTAAAPTGSLVVQVPASAAMLIAIGMLAVIAVILQRARRTALVRYAEVQDSRATFPDAASDFGD